MINAFFRDAPILRPARIWSLLGDGARIGRSSVFPPTCDHPSNPPTGIWSFPCSWWSCARVRCDVIESYPGVRLFIVLVFQLLASSFLLSLFRRLCINGVFECVNQITLGTPLHSHLFAMALFLVVSQNLRSSLDTWESELHPTLYGSTSVRLSGFYSEWQIKRAQRLPLRRSHPTNDWSITHEKERYDVF